MVPHSRRLWTRSGQLHSPQDVDGRKSPNLWRTAVTRRVFEQLVADPWARKDGERRPDRLRRGAGSTSEGPRTASERLQRDHRQTSERLQGGTTSAAHPLWIASGRFPDAVGTSSGRTLLPARRSAYRPQAFGSLARIPTKPPRDCAAVSRKITIAFMIGVCIIWHQQRRRICRRPRNLSEL